MINELLVYTDGRFVCGEKEFRCALGLNGVTAHKVEGDGATPSGRFPLRRVLYRGDRVVLPSTELPVEELRPDQGCCTDPTHPEYNALISLPHHGSHESLWREDSVYDIIVPLGYNDDIVLPGRGSAIFMHVAREGYSPTEGCVALSKSDLLTVLRSITASVHITFEV